MERRYEITHYYEAELTNKSIKALNVMFRYRACYSSLCFNFYNFGTYYHTIVTDCLYQNYIFFVYYYKFFKLKINWFQMKKLFQRVSTFDKYQTFTIDEKSWKDPLKFNPNRFLHEETQKRHPFCFVPFVYGVRNCIGK